MIGPSSLRLRMLCQRLAINSRSLSTSGSGSRSRSSLLRHCLQLKPNHLLALQLTSLNGRMNAMNVRCINTTKKNKDHHTIDIYDPDYVDTKKPEGPKTAKEFADVKSQKNWISYGFDFIDPANDRSLMNFTFFTMITMGFVVFTYIIYYFPDFVLHDWAIREGFLELDRRERLGLPLIDRNLVDPAKLDLPTDEELGDYKVYT